MYIVSVPAAEVLKAGGLRLVAKNIRMMNENELLIFVSGFDRSMMELFGLDVFAFVKNYKSYNNLYSFIKLFL